MLKIGLKMGSFLKYGDPSGKTDGGIELAVSENPILDTSHADLRRKFFSPKKWEKGLVHGFFRFLTIFKKIEIMVVIY